MRHPRGTATPSLPTITLCVCFISWTAWWTHQGGWWQEGGACSPPPPPPHPRTPPPHGLHDTGGTHQALPLPPCHHHSLLRISMQTVWSAQQGGWQQRGACSASPQTSFTPFPTLSHCGPLTLHECSPPPLCMTLVASTTHSRFPLPPPLHAGGHQTLQCGVHSREVSGRGGAALPPHHLLPPPPLFPLPTCHRQSCGGHSRDGSSTEGVALLHPPPLPRSLILVAMFTRLNTRPTLVHVSTGVHFIEDVV